jgi:putative flippase GtrA
MFKIKLPEKIEQFVYPKIKFASTSLIATILDYIIYLTLVYSGFNKVYSNVISASIGFLVNFFLQKKFIFTLRRKAHHTFLISMSFSAAGIGISTLFIFLFNKNVFLDHHQYITKLLVMGIMFFYNFYTKRIAFEKSLR